MKTGLEKHLVLLLKLQAVFSNKQTFTKIVRLKILSDFVMQMTGGRV